MPGCWKLSLLALSALLALAPGAQAAACKSGKAAGASAACKGKPAAKPPPKRAKPAARKNTAKAARTARPQTAVMPAPTLRPSREMQVKPPAAPPAQGVATAQAPPLAVIAPASVAAPPPQMPTVAVPKPPVAPPEVPATLVPELPRAMTAQSFGYSSACYIDTLDGQLWESDVLPVKDRKSILIQGWAIDDNAKALADSTLLRLESAKGKRYYGPTTPVERPDVAKYLGRPDYRMAGYRARVSAEGLPAGEYEVMVVMNSAGRNIICDSGRRFRLDP